METLRTMSQTLGSRLLKCLHHLPFNHPSFQHILIYYLLGPSHNWLWGHKDERLWSRGEKTNAGEHLCKMEASRKQMCVIAVRPGSSYVIQQPFPSSNSERVHLSINHKALMAPSPGKPTSGSPTFWKAEMYLPVMWRWSTLPHTHTHKGHQHSLAENTIRAISISPSGIKMGFTLPSIAEF